MIYVEHGLCRHNYIRDLKMRSLGLLGWALNAMMSVPIRNTQIRNTQTPKEKIQTHRRESHLKTEAEIVVM